MTMGSPESTGPPRETTRDLAVRLDFAVEMAWRAGRVTLAHFQNRVAAEAKADGSPVTVADRAAEQLCRDLIQQYYPRDGILGEEFGPHRPEARLRWVLDPIDGTRSFVRGVPLYGVLIALEDDGDPVLGVIHLPGLNESVYAARGLGCWWDGRRARVSPVSQLSEALLLLTDHVKFSPALLNRLSSASGMVRTWGDCYAYAMVATGRAEIAVDPVMAIWDAAPLRPIIEEAGGSFTDWTGVPTHVGGNAIATNAALAESARRLFDDPAYPDARARAKGGWS